MKRNHNIVIAATMFALTLSLFTSCEGDLEPINYNRISTDNFLQTVNDYDVALTAIYASIGNLRRDRIVFGERGTDEYRSNNGGEDKLNNFEWTSSDQFGQIYWNNVQAITRTGTFIIELEKTAVLSDEIRNNYIAQVKTARAFLMYEILTNYGACPVITDKDILAEIYNNFDYKPKRPKPGTPEYVTYYNDYLKFIEDDLNAAIQEFDKAGAIQGYNDFGRFNKGVSLTILSKLYMHEKRWADLENTCKTIIDLAENATDPMFKYSLYPKYNDMWSLSTEKHAEIIFAIPQTAGLYGQSFRAWTLHPHYTADENAFNGDKVRIPFYDSFQANDIRRNNITITFTNIYSGKTVDMRKPPHNGGFIFKYQPDPDGPMASGVDVIVYRLADIYLSYAEAICWKEGGTTSNSVALKYFNMVRERAGVAKVLSINTNEILQERGWELYFEGFRREDLIRHGKYISKAAEERKVNAQDYQVLYPIPLGAILENPNIYQNSGYNF